FPPQFPGSWGKVAPGGVFRYRLRKPSGTLSRRFEHFSRNGLKRGSVRRPIRLDTRRKDEERHGVNTNRVSPQELSLDAGRPGSDKGIQDSLSIWNRFDKSPCNVIRKGQNGSVPTMTE